jgi:hypothetical protein
MNDTNLLNILLCSGSNIDVLKTFDSFVFTPLMWGKLIKDKMYLFIKMINIYLILSPIAFH